MNDVKFSLKNGKLVIEVPLGEPRPSASGKTQVVCTTGGFLPTGENYKGKPMKANVTITIPNN